MPPRPRPVEDLTWEVRRLFRELSQAADNALAPLGITAAERALLEFLAREAAPTSLSEIARKRAVSRQHIHQTLARLDPKWIVRADDPDDGRSVVLSLSAAGRAFWKRIRAVDRQLMARLDKQVDRADARAAAATLHRLRAILKSMQENG
jgi:DNA-binding MarR family transcriptional regulator